MLAKKDMNIRTIEERVTFYRPFLLPSVDEMLPPGTYLFETEEEQISSMSMVAYRRISTTIALPAIGVDTGTRQVVSIDPSELTAARARDELGIE